MLQDSSSYPLSVYILLLPVTPFLPPAFSLCVRRIMSIQNSHVDTNRHQAREFLMSKTRMSWAPLDITISKSVLQESLHRKDCSMEGWDDRLTRQTVDP